MSDISTKLIDTALSMDKHGNITHYNVDISQLLKESAQHIDDLSLRIAVAHLLLKNIGIHNPHSFDALRVLKMPIESLHEFIKQNPQYGDV